MLGDISTGRFRPCIPVPFRQIVFDRLYSLSHGGIKATRRLISEQFVWPNMKTGIKVWCQTCLACQETKVTRPTVAPLMHFNAPDGQFAIVCIDIVEPLNESEGFSYNLTVVDRFTRWPEAIPLRNVTAKSCADAFLLNWVARFGCSTDIITDRSH